VFSRRWTRLVVTTCAAAALIGGPAPARAQPGDAAPAEDAKLAEAKRLFDAGSQDYNLGNFAAAIEKFEAAYGLTRATPLLYNIAQAYTRRHEVDPDPAHLRKAKALFGNFVRLSEASGEDVRDARERVAQLDAQLAALGEPDDKEPEPEPEGPKPEPEPAPEPAPATRAKYRPGGVGIAGYVAVFSGMALGAGLGAAGFVSAGRIDDQRATEGLYVPLPGSRQQVYDDAARKSRTLAYAGIGAGAALVVVGVALIVVDAVRGRKAPARARLGPSGLEVRF
jgi:tetratricopeptide (TPR) repeat protein